MHERYLDSLKPVKQTKKKSQHNPVNYFKIENHTKKKPKM